MQRVVQPVPLGPCACKWGGPIGLQGGKIFAFFGAKGSLDRQWSTISAWADDIVGFGVNATQKIPDSKSDGGDEENDPCHIGTPTIIGQLSEHVQRRAADNGANNESQHRCNRIRIVWSVLSRHRHHSSSLRSRKTRVSRRSLFRTSDIARSAGRIGGARTEMTMTARLPVQRNQDRR